MYSLDLDHKLNASVRYFCVIFIFCLNQFSNGSGIHVELVSNDGFTLLYYSSIFISMKWHVCTFEYWTNNEM